MTSHLFSCFNCSLLISKRPHAQLVMILNMKAKGMAKHASVHTHSGIIATHSIDHSDEVSLPDIGYAYGYLLADEIAENYQSLLKSLLGDKWYDEVSGRGVRFQDHHYSDWCI